MKGVVEPVALTWFDHYYPGRLPYQLFLIPRFMVKICVANCMAFLSSFDGEVRRGLLNLPRGERAALPPAHP